MPVRLMGEVVADHQRGERPRWTPSTRATWWPLDGIAAQVASAIRNARLFEEKVRALRSLEILQEITNVLNSDLELDALLERIARRSVEAVQPAQTGAVLLFDDERAAGPLQLRLRAAGGAGAGARLAFHEGLPGSVFVSGQGRLVASDPRDYGRSADAFREAAGGADAHAARSACRWPCPRRSWACCCWRARPPRPPSTPATCASPARWPHQAAIAIGNALHLQPASWRMDRQRQEYLSNVSHELRTPLTVIQGYLEALAAAGPRRAGRPATWRRPRSSASGWAA